MERKTINTSGWLLVFTLSLACAPGRPVDVPPLQVPWEPFYWVSAVSDSAQFDNTAMLFRLQVRGDGPPSLVQLDLGGSGDMPHGFPRTTRDLNVAAGPRRGELYGLLGASVPRTLLGGGSDTLLANWQSREIGTVGLLNYLGNVLIIDFSKRRLAALPSTIAMEALLGTSMVSVEIVREQLERLIIPLTDATGRQYRVLLDTGLSPFVAWTSREMWQDLTGLGGPGPQTRTYTIPNPLGGMTFIAGTMKRQLRAGTLNLSVREVVYMANGPTGAPLEQWAQPVDMVLGPAAFAHGGAVAIDLKKRRVGFAKKLAQ